LTESGDEIPIAEYYRGIGIFIDQPAQRIRDVVRPEIDLIFDLHDPSALFAFACDHFRCPEARLFAGAKLLTMFEMAAEHRWTRPGNITREEVHAATAGLNSLRWRDPWHYGCMLRSPMPGQHREPPRREVPLVDDWRDFGRQ
jgi:hypothetical protein